MGLVADSLDMLADALIMVKPFSCSSLYNAKKGVAKELEEENCRFKHMHAKLALDLKLAKEIIEKSFKALPEKADC